MSTELVSRIGKAPLYICDVMRFVLALLVCLSSFPVLGQAVAPVDLHTREYYQQKSEEQRHLAKVFLIGGSAMMFTGMIGFNGNTGPGDRGAADVYGYMFVGGSLLGLASVPLFISASRNEKRATARLSLENRRLELPGKDSYASCQPSVTLTIRLK